jgi:hypothetical protein
MLAALLAAAPPAGAAAPDSAARAALQEAIGGRASVQVVDPAGGTLLFPRPTVRDDGLHRRTPWKPPRAALFVSRDVPPPPRPPELVPWSAIGQVQVRRSSMGRGMLHGAVFGTLFVGMLFAIYHRPILDDWDASAPVVFSVGTTLIGGSAALGLVLGSYDEGWRTVYPAPPPGGH